MKIAFIAGPYRAPTIRAVVENIRAAEAVALDLWRLGYAVICPHLNSALLDGAVPDEVFLAGDLELLARSDLVVALSTWSESVGARGEVEAAWARGIPVFEWPSWTHIFALEPEAAGVAATEPRERRED